MGILGGLVVMNPQNGGILALISEPTYDANGFNQGLKAEEYKSLSDNPDHPLFNRMVQGLYPSGSTIQGDGPLIRY